MQQKVNTCATNGEDAVKVIQEFKDIIKNKKSDITWLVCHQGRLFQKFKEKERFVSMVLKFSTNKSTIVFKIALSKLIENYLKIKNSSLSLHYLQKQLKIIRDICKGNASEFKKIIEICFNTLALLLTLFCLKF